VRSFLLETKMTAEQRTDLRQRATAPMVLKSLDALVPLLGCGIGRSIEPRSGDRLSVNQGTVYPLLFKLEQECSVASEWSASGNNRPARFYHLTVAGHKQLQVEARDWNQTATILGRFFAVEAEDFS
jgi:PadR family transcriptional regulator, regulatory protein PadR